MTILLLVPRLIFCRAWNFFYFFFTGIVFIRSLKILSYGEEGREEARAREMQLCKTNRGYTK